MNTQDIKIGEKIFALFKGVPGCGKSSAAHSWYIEGPTFTYDFDRKMDAIASRYKGKSFEYEQFDDCFKALTHLRALKNNCPYRTVIWDGWHSYAQLCLKSALAFRAPGKKTITTGNVERYQIEDYGVEGRAIEQATDDLQYLYNEKGVNIITVAHWRRVAVYDIRSKSEEIVEGLFIPGGKMAFAVPIPYNELYWFSVEISMETGEPEYICETSGSHETKTVLSVPNKIKWTGKNFCEILKGEHARESRVIRF